jgi:hypothetical protein
VQQPSGAAAPPLSSDPPKWLADIAHELPQTDLSELTGGSPSDLTPQFLQVNQLSVPGDAPVDRPLT